MASNAACKSDSATSVLLRPVVLLVLVVVMVFVVMVRVCCVGWNGSVDYASSSMVNAHMPLC